MKKYKPSLALLLTDDQEITLAHEEKSITVMSVWKWLLEDPAPVKKGAK